MVWTPAVHTPVASIISTSEALAGSPPLWDTLVTAGRVVCRPIRVLRQPPSVIDAFSLFNPGMAGPRPRCPAIPGPYHGISVRVRVAEHRLVDDHGPHGDISGAFAVVMARLFVVEAASVG